VILNRRSYSDPLGELTFVGQMGQSVIDICGVSISSLDYVKNFKIGSQVFSDHFPLEIEVELLQISNKFQTSFNTSLPILFWSKQNPQQYKNKLDCLIKSKNTTILTESEDCTSLIDLIHEAAVKPRKESSKRSTTTGLIVIAIKPEINLLKCSNYFEKIPLC
jgi:hypothetical protein